jgi:predicted NBD/HSP70 family sugar kinase
MARRILAQQAATIGRLLTVCAAIVDPDAFFVGGGVLEASEDYRQWFLGEVRRHLRLRPEQRGVEVAVVPGGDMAGARGAALVALAALADRSVGGSPDVC